MNFPLSISAADAISLFPKIIGPITGAVLINNRATIVLQGADAYTVVIDGEFRACCPKASLAEAFIVKELKASDRRQAAADRRKAEPEDGDRRGSQVRIEVIYRDDVASSGAVVQLFRIYAAGEPVLECRRYPSQLVKGL